jgi:hypothetical protein
MAETGITRSVYDAPHVTSRGELGVAQALGSLGNAPDTPQWRQNAASLAQYLFKPMGLMQYGGGDDARKMMQLYGMPNEDISRYIASISSPLATDQTRRINFANFAEATLTAVSVTVDQVMNTLYQKIFDSGWALKLLPLDTSPELANINTFTWQVFEFMDATPLVQPHGSLSRTFGMKMRARSATKSRYGRSIEIDLESLLTPKGYEKIKDSITWLIGCTDMLIARLIIAALMETNYYDRPFRITNHQSFIDEIRRKMAQCYVVNKSEAPMRSIELKADEEMQFRSVPPPDTVIMTSNTYRKVTNVPEQMKFSNTGIPVNYDNRQVSGASVRSIPPAVMSTKQVYAYHNAMQRDSQELETYNVYGTHNMMGLDPAVENLKPCPGMFDFLKFCFTNGDFRLIRYMQGVDNCGLFDEKGNVRPARLNGQRPDYDNWYPEYGLKDPWTDDTNQPIKFTGQMRLKEPHALRKIARHFCLAYALHTSRTPDAVHLAFTDWWEEVQKNLTTPIEQLKDALASATFDSFPAAAVAYSSVVKLSTSSTDIGKKAYAFLNIFRSFVDFLHDAWKPLLVEPNMAPLEVNDQSRYAAAYHHLFLQEGTLNEPLAYLARVGDQGIPASASLKTTDAYINAFPDAFAGLKEPMKSALNSTESAVKLGVRYFLLGTKYLTDANNTVLIAKLLESIKGYQLVDVGDSPVQKLAIYVQPMHSILAEAGAQDNQQMWNDFQQALSGGPALNAGNVYSVKFGDVKILPYAVRASAVKELASAAKDGWAIQDPAIPEIFIPFSTAIGSGTNFQPSYNDAVRKLGLSVTLGGARPSAVPSGLKSLVDKVLATIENAAEKAGLNAMLNYVAENRNSDLPLLSSKFPDFRSLYLAFSGTLGAGETLFDPDSFATGKLVGSTTPINNSDVFKRFNDAYEKSGTAKPATIQLIRFLDGVITYSDTSETVKEALKLYYEEPLAVASSIGSGGAGSGTLAKMGKAAPMSPVARLQHAMDNSSTSFVGSTATRIQPSFGMKVPYAIPPEEVAGRQKLLSNYAQLARNAQYVAAVRLAAYCGNRAEAVAYLGLLSSPFTRDMIANSVERCIAPPLNILLTQPAIVDICEAVVAMKQGKETGMSRVDHIDNRQGISVETKQWKMHFTLWIGAFVGRPEYVNVMRFADYKKHICGGGDDFGTKRSDFQTSDPNNTTHRRSLLAIPVPCDEWPNDDIEDITGIMNYPDGVTPEERKNHELFSSGWRRAADLGLSNRQGFNTLTSRGAVKRMDHLTGKYCLLENDAGPWGKLANEDLRRNLSLYAPQRT